MNQPKYLILTVDYELFGNGTGNIDCCIVNPANKMIEVANSFQAPITFFVETSEFIAMEQVVSMKNDIKLIRAQLQHAYSTGHDAQLHIHPQWLGANYDIGKWQLHMEKWRIGDLSHSEITLLISEGKQWLEALINDVDIDYQVHAFRAGGWCIQPSTNVIDVLKKERIYIDSTVAPGRRDSSKGKWFDFRKSPLEPYWLVESDVCMPVNKGVFEAPIVTAKISPFRHFKALRKAREFNNGGMATGCCGNYETTEGSLQKFIDKIKKVLNLGQVMLDFSTMPADVLISITEEWIKKNEGQISPIPIVAIAHTKNFTAASEIAFKEYLEWAQKQHIKFSTFEQWKSAMEEFNETK